MSGYHFPEVPDIEAAYRAAFRALEKLAPQNAAWVHEADSDFSDILSQFSWIVGEADMAVAGTFGPRITWRGEHHVGNWDLIVAETDLDGDGEAFGVTCLDDCVFQGTDGTWHGGALDQAARVYRRECGWDFSPGESGVWLLMLAPVSAVGGSSGEPWFYSGHLAGFVILHDRDKDGTYESVAHMWTAKAWRRRGIARRLLGKARSTFGTRDFEGPFTEDGAAFVRASELFEEVTR